MTTRPAGRHARLFWGTALVALLMDVVTKALAHQLLVRHRAIPVLGDLFQLTLVYNPGAAFGLHVGSYSRSLFLAVAAVALFVLWRMYRETGPGGKLRLVALGLLWGGAGGNLINRLWSPSGVVDFIDVGIGTVRWPTFNVADIAVSSGALALCWALWDEDTRSSGGDTPLTLPSGTR